MGFAKYAEDNEEILLERVRNRPYELRVNLILADNADIANRKAEKGYSTELDWRYYRGN